MEKIMRKTNDTEKTNELPEPTRELTETELVVVSGGLKALETFGKALAKAGQI
jgi:hypothetical protein